MRSYFTDGGLRISEGKQFAHEPTVELGLCAVYLTYFVVLFGEKWQYGVLCAVLTISSDLCLLFC